MRHAQWFMTLPLKKPDTNSTWETSLHSGAAMWEGRRNIHSVYLLEKTCIFCIIEIITKILFWIWRLGGRDTLFFFFLKMESNFCKRDRRVCLTAMAIMGYLEQLGLTTLFKMGIFLIFNNILWLYYFFWCRNVCSPLQKVQIGEETKWH